MKKCITACQTKLCCSDIHGQKNFHGRIHKMEERKCIDLIQSQYSGLGVPQGITFQSLGMSYDERVQSFGL
jgi:hypothetical protein